MRKLKASSALEMQRCQMRLQVTVSSAAAGAGAGDSSAGLAIGELRKLRGRLASKFPQPTVKIESEQIDDTGLTIVC